MPDEATLALCSLVVGFCFAITFELIARHGRARLHWRLWALGNLTSSLGVIGFDLTPHPVAAIPAFVFYTMLAAGPLTICAGLDSFARRRFPVRSGVVLAVLPGLAYVLAPAGPFGTTSLPQVAAGVGLAIALAATGLHLVFARASQLTTARRLLGLAMLANLPSYASALALPVQPTGMFDVVAHYAWMSQPILTLIINLALLAIPGLHAMDELRCTALTDTLTGLRNRAWLAGAEPSCAKRGGMVAALDLDDFKQVNDRHGHAAGDALLIAIAASLRSWCMRNGAEAIRLGGDEFLILMPNASDQVAGDLRRHVGSGRSDSEGMPRWSTSIGFAPYPTNSASLNDAIKAADLALYRDKAAKELPAVAQAA